MSSTINYYIHSMLARRSLSKNVDALNKVMVQISSGEKFTSPKDDPVSFNISQKMQLSIHNSEYLVSNIEFSKDFLEVAVSGLDSINENLERVRNLCQQGASNIYSTAQRSALTGEISQRLEEIDRLAEAISFRDITLLNGYCSNLKFQIGVTSDPFESILNVGSAFINVHTSALGLDTTIFDPDNPPSADDFAAYIEKTESASGAINASITKMGIFENSLIGKQDFLNDTIEIKNTYRSNLTDTDVAYAASEMAKQQIIENINVALWQQANQIPATAMQLLK